MLRWKVKSVRLPSENVHDSAAMKDIFSLIADFKGINFEIAGGLHINHIRLQEGEPCVNFYPASIIGRPLIHT